MTGDIMTQAQAEEVVRLAQDLPELGLRRGDLGVVCSTWFAPNTVFEVDFRAHVPGCRVRALLMPNQIEKSETR